MDASLGIACAAVALLCAVASGAEAAVWVADPLVKVFREDQPPTEPPTTIELKAARGEYESAQVCVRAAEAITGLRVAPTALRGEAGTIPATAVTWNPVGYVPLTHNTYHTPDDELIAKAPTDVPDPLLPPEPVDAAADMTQPLWITVSVPRDAAPGDYEGTLAVPWEGGEESVALKLTVWPFELPEEQHLAFTNWINPGALAKHHGVELYSDEFWAILGAYARVASEHHQNVLWVNLGLVGIAQDPNGQFSHDWERFDLWVETVSENGCGRLIEIQPLGHWADGWESTEIAFHGYNVETPEGPKSLPAEEVLPKLLPALQAHLEERGWVDRTVIHIADEPAVHHVASWSEKSAWVKSLAPKLRRLDAIEAPDFGEHLEIWVPKLNHFYNWQTHYDAAREAGAEMWFYTCCHPTAGYPNRFLDFPLMETRILQWYNWRFSMSGYLHWGLNFWDDDPLNSCGGENLPPGDCWIVYPGEDGPLSSIRFEALRDGFEDYETLWLLAERTRQIAEELSVPEGAFDPDQRSDELARMLVRGVVDYSGDPDELRAVREAAAGEIIQLDAGPKAVVATEPPTYHELAGWPIVVATRIWTEDGCEVQVNGGAAHKQPDGSWAHHTFLGKPTDEVTVTITKGDATKTVVRRFATVDGG